MVVVTAPSLDDDARFGERVEQLSVDELVAKARVEALQRCKLFVADYRDALRRWCAGARDAVFPAGTYLMAWRFDVAIAET